MLPPRLMGVLQELVWNNTAFHGEGDEALPSNGSSFVIKDGLGFG